MRHDWTTEEIASMWRMPINDLLFSAHQVHRQYFNPNQIQISTLVNIKSGGCPEDCAYCPQSARYQTGVDNQPLMAIGEIEAAASAAKAQGATRLCLGAAWRSVKDRDLPVLARMIETVRSHGLECCMTLGMLTHDQANALAAAGLDYYNHNLDTSADHYTTIITTRTYEQRLQTIENVRDAGMKVCCGGIIGMGEKSLDRAGLLVRLAAFTPHPESVPINQLVRVEGTPLHQSPDIDPFDVVRTIAAARIVLPSARVRLSAGRRQMDDSTQALCFFAGANSLFYGDKLLTTENPEQAQDRLLFQRLGLEAESMPTDESLYASIDATV